MSFDFHDPENTPSQPDCNIYFNNQFIGEEAADWASHVPAIGPANDARVKTVLLAGHWLQDNAALIVKAVNCHDELLEVCQMVASSIKVDELALITAARAAIARAQS